MRVKRDHQLSLCFRLASVVSELKIVQEFQARYKRISDLLDKNPEILEWVHEDLKRLSVGKKEDGKGERKSGYTSENIFRSLIVLCVEGLSFRDAVVRIADSGILWEFARLGMREMMDFTFLNKCYNAIRPETWEAIHRVLGRYAQGEGLIDPKVVRTDTTVVEANIHYPTDSALLWDSYRVSVRWIRRAKGLVKGVERHRFHDDKVKGHSLYITRYIGSGSKGRKREVRRRFRKLIASVRRVWGIGAEVCEAAKGSLNWELAEIGLELGYYLPAVKTVADVAERVAVRGERVGAGERVFSIFEQHVELIKRGKRGKPVEFGHKVVLSQTREKFISDYEVLPEQVEEGLVLEEELEDHKGLYGAYPEVSAGDGGLWAGEEAMERMGKKVGVLAVPKRVTDWGKEWMNPWQAFRAGIEGTISVLKRAFGLMKCLFRGFKNFASAVGMAVFCHNLICLTRT